MSTTDRGDVQWLRISQRNPLAAATPSPLASGRLKNTSGRPLRSRPNALPANYQLPAVTPGSLRKTLGTARTTWAAGASGGSGGAGGTAGAVTTTSKPGPRRSFGSKTMGAPSGEWKSAPGARRTAPVARLSKAATPKSQADWGVCSVKGRRPYMEDEWRVVPDMRSLGSEDQIADCSATVFYGVFDGHAGKRASKAVARALPEYITTQAGFTNNLSGAITAGFAQMEHEFLIMAARCRMLDGTTAITAFIRDGVLVVGNVGDSRAVLSCNGQAVAVSIDHKPNRPSEKSRIIR
jgi:hypothetical protein